MLSLLQEAGEQAISKSRLVLEVSSLLYPFNWVLIIIISKARVNIPGIHKRTLRRDIASGSFTTGAGVQVSLRLLVDC